MPEVTAMTSVNGIHGTDRPSDMAMTMTMTMTDAESESVSRVGGGGIREGQQGDRKSGNAKAFDEA